MFNVKHLFNSNLCAILISKILLNEKIPSISRVMICFSAWLITVITNYK